jgi:hypothetical protein
MPFRWLRASPFGGYTAPDASGHDMDQRNFSITGLILRIIGGLVLIAAIWMLFLPPDYIARSPKLPVWSAFFASIGVVTAIWGIAAILTREKQAPKELVHSINRLQQQIMDLGVKINDLQLLSERASRPMKPVTVKDYTAELESLQASLAELKTVALLPDAQRNRIAEDHRRQQRESRIKQVFDVIGAHDWAGAERELNLLESEFPGDDDVAKARHYLDHTRRLFETETMARAVCEIEDLGRAGSWDVARERSRNLLTGFPHNEMAKDLHTRIERDFHNFQEASIQRTFDEIRTHIENREWRKALALAERMIEQYPHHRLTDRIHDQLRTLMDNAEIEERQVLEIRIQEYLRDGKFDQAIELAEDVIARYPHSPQAESLKALLPRIREIAAGGINEFAGLGQISPFRSEGPIQSSSAGLLE